MKGLWIKVIARMTFWLMAEIALTSIGIDDLADYSEFVFDKKLLVNMSYVYTKPTT